MSKATVDEPPKCKLCEEHHMTLIGEMNGVKIRFCEKCDRINKPKRG